MNKILIAGLALVAVMTSCGGAAITNTYKTTLSPANEVPPVTAAGATGTVSAYLDINTKVLTVSGTYTGLTGPIVSPGAHLHGPAAVGVNAPPVFFLTFPATGTSGALSGTFTLSDTQVTEFNEGKFYVNLHTTANNGGEVRGQLIKQ